VYTGAWQRLRGRIARCMIEDRYCEEFDIVSLYVVPKTVEYDSASDTYTCLLCGRLFKGFKAIFFHILVYHSYDVDYYVRRYLIEKYKRIGWFYE